MSAIAITEKEREALEAEKADIRASLTKRPALVVKITPAQSATPPAAPIPDPAPPLPLDPTGPSVADLERQLRETRPSSLRPSAAKPNAASTRR